MARNKREYIAQGDAEKNLLNDRAPCGVAPRQTALVLIKAVWVHAPSLPGPRKQEHG
jgi:hypothetical protein